MWLTLDFPRLKSEGDYINSRIILDGMNENQEAGFWINIVTAYVFIVIGFGLNEICIRLKK